MSDKVKLVKRLEKLLPTALADQVAEEVVDSLWLAEHDEEVRAGFVAEEPEWEYGISYAPGNEEFEGQDLATIQRRVKYIRRTNGYYSGSVHAVRRIRAGDSVPVKQEGGEQ